MHLMQVTKSAAPGIAYLRRHLRKFPKLKVEKYKNRKRKAQKLKDRSSKIGIYHLELSFKQRLQ